MHPLTLENHLLIKGVIISFSFFFSLAKSDTTNIVGLCIYMSVLAGNNVMILRYSRLSAFPMDCIEVNPRGQG